MVPARPFLEGKTWLGAVEGLDLALLVESEDNGPLRGIDVETHHVAQLFNEVRSVDSLKYSMRWGCSP